VKAAFLFTGLFCRAGPRLEHAYSVTLDVLTDLVELTQRPGVASASTIHSASLTIVR